MVRHGLHKRKSTKFYSQGLTDRILETIFSVPKPKIAFWSFWPFWPKYVKIGMKIFALSRDQIISNEKSHAYSILVKNVKNVFGPFGPFFALMKFWSCSKNRFGSKMTISRNSKIYQVIHFWNQRENYWYLRNLKISNIRANTHTKLLITRPILIFENLWIRKS